MSARKIPRPSHSKNSLGHQTLSGISQATMGLRAPDHSGKAGDSLSIKHDELADAVQSALSSIYGNSPHPIPSPRQETSPRPPKPNGGSANWARRTVSVPRTSSSITSVTILARKPPRPPHPVRSPAAATMAAASTVPACARASNRPITGRIGRLHLRGSAALRRPAVLSGSRRVHRARQGRIGHGS